jgi:pimeloyl-ACP methyl ester carboxylesterase
MRHPGKLLLVLCALLVSGELTFAEERPLPQLRVFHRAGQTFATWKEVAGEGVTYNLYRAESPITTENLSGAQLVATGIPQGSAHDFIADRIARFRASVARREAGARQPDAGAGETQPDAPPQNFTVTVKDGPLPAGTGLFVSTSNQNRVSFYALTAVWAEGGEDRRVQVGANSQLEKVPERSETTGPILIGREGPAEPAPAAAAETTITPSAGVRQLANATGSVESGGKPAAGASKGGNPGEVRLDYVHWATPEQASVDGHPYRFRLILKSAEEKTAGLGLIVRLHPYTGNYSMTTWTQPGFITLGLDDFTPAIDEQEHHSFWFGYPENLGRSGRGAYLRAESGVESTAAGGKQTKGAGARQAKGAEATGAGGSGVPVRDYTQKRISWAIDGVMEHFRVDPNRVYLTGSSMGGTGTVHFGLRHPELFAALDAVVPLINPARSKAWGHNLLGRLWGSEDWPTLPDGEGHTVGERLDDTAYILSASADLPLLKFFNARQDTAIGWTQIPEFIQALEQARQPFLAAWDNGGHGGPRPEVTQSFKDFNVFLIPRNRCVPALSNASTADDPGTGDPAAGDLVGALNDDFRWAVEKDTATELVLRLWRVPKSGKFASAMEATVDVTPRRRQAFRPGPGSQVSVRNLSAADGSVLQQASITVEPTGLFTARQVRVGLEPGSRLTFSVSPEN